MCFKPRAKRSFIDRQVRRDDPAGDWPGHHAVHSLFHHASIRRVDKSQLDGLARRQLQTKHVAKRLHLVPLVRPQNIQRLLLNLTDDLLDLASERVDLDDEASDGSRVRVRCQQLLELLLVLLHLLYERLQRLRFLLLKLNQTLDRKSTRLNSSHIPLSRMPSS